MDCNCLTRTYPFKVGVIEGLPSLFFCIFLGPYKPQTSLFFACLTSAYTSHPIET